MPANDGDYKISQDQLIKVVKIMLHKINFNYKKSEQRFSDVKEAFNKSIADQGKTTRSSMEEVNQYLQMVHQDFEGFLDRHKTEHSEINHRFQKLSDVSSKTLDNLDSIKSSVEGFATIMSCLMEFNSIQQSLSYQEEIDRNKLQLLAIQSFHKNISQAQTSASKDFSPIKRTNLSVNSLKGGPMKQNSNFFPTYQTVEVNNDSVLFQQDSILEKQSNDKSSTRNDRSNNDLMDQSIEQPVAKVVPSLGKVTYRSQVLQRSQLMEMRKTLLEKCEEVVDSLVWPFQKNNLKPEKIFNDLIQFHQDHNNTSMSGALGLLNSITQEDSLGDARPLTHKFKNDNIGRRASQDTGPKTSASGFTGRQSNTRRKRGEKFGQQSPQSIQFYNNKNRIGGVNFAKVTSPKGKIGQQFRIHAPNSLGGASVNSSTPFPLSIPTPSHLQ